MKEKQPSRNGKISGYNPNAELLDDLRAARDGKILNQGILDKTKKVGKRKNMSAGQAAEKLGLSHALKGNGTEAVGYNAYAAMVSAAQYQDNPKAFKRHYGITIEQAAQLEKLVYG